MSQELVKAIQRQTEVLFVNADIMLRTCDPDFVLCGMPIWKHVYHMLHSCDRWFINPAHYAEPDFHEPDLNSLDVKSERTLSREELLEYLCSIRDKVTQYVQSLTDDMLYDVPPGCKSNRLMLILSQLRHFYAHLGNINATTILQTGRWPRVIGESGRSGASTHGFYE
ncbi:MAG: hypothetical protein PHO66_03240 [Eubacteriales bacterium]|nr:hypothetical protein [Eubacteriales bacterium]